MKIVQIVFHYKTIHKLRTSPLGRITICFHICLVYVAMAIGKNINMFMWLNRRNIVFITQSLGGIIFFRIDSWNYTNHTLYGYDRSHHPAAPVCLVEELSFSPCSVCNYAGCTAYRMTHDLQQSILTVIQA